LMKDPNKSLASYKVGSGSKIFMMGERELKVPQKPTSPQPSSTHSSSPVPQPQSLEQQLDGFVEHIQTNLVAKIQTLEREIANPVATHKNLLYSVREAGELLLQTQLKVDGIVSDDEAIRAKRKQVNKLLNSYLDKVDELKVRINNLPKL
ncbi:hypothetical protein HDU91_001926, partial [Kappamyces sp. JEL0680]